MYICMVGQLWMISLVPWATGHIYSQATIASLRMFSKAARICKQTSDNQIIRVERGLICVLTSLLQEPAIPSFSPLKLSQGIV